jgi:hypothetical protein
MHKLFIRLKFLVLAIILVLPCFFQFGALNLFAGEHSEKIYVAISDGDDTIAASHIVQRNIPLTTVAHAFNQFDAFIGSAELYRSLSAKGVQFEYVSGMPERFDDVSSGGLTNFLTLNNFPVSGDSHFRKSIFEKTYNYKTRTIKEIITEYKKQNPNTHLVLLFFGDNGEKDILVYKNIKESLYENHETKVSVGATFIHKLYDGNPALELQADQIPYITFADLALQIQIRFPNLLTRDESTKILELVRDGLLSEEITLNSSRNLTLPHWAEITDTDLRKMDEIFDTKGFRVNKDLRESVKNLIHKRVAYIRTLSIRKIEK